MLKSGCRAEESLLCNAERVVNLLAVSCVVAWRVFWLSVLRRAAPQSAPTLVLTAEECRVLDQLVPVKPIVGAEASTLSGYLVKVARLDGYLARTKDPPPGHTVIWRGLCRLADLLLGVELSTATCG